MILIAVIYSKGLLDVKHLMISQEVYLTGSLVYQVCLSEQGQPKFSMMMISFRDAS